MVMNIKRSRKRSPQDFAPIRHAAVPLKADGGGKMPHDTHPGRAEQRARSLSLLTIVHDRRRRRSQRVEAFRQLCDLVYGFWQSAEATSSETLKGFLIRLAQTIYRQSARNGMAVEIAQDVMLALFNNMSTLRNPRAWLIRVTRNVAVGYLRHELRLPTLPLDEGRAVETPAATPTPASPRQRQLRHAIDRLASPAREIVKMRMDGATAPEIASRMGMSKEAVRQQLSRATTRLAEALKAGGASDHAG